MGDCMKHFKIFILLTLISCNNFVFAEKHMLSSGVPGSEQAIQLLEKAHEQLPNFKSQIRNDSKDQQKWQEDLLAIFRKLKLASTQFYGFGIICLHYRDLMKSIQPAEARPKSIQVSALPSKLTNIFVTQSSQEPLSNEQLTEIDWYNDIVSCTAQEYHTRKNANDCIERINSYLEKLKKEYYSASEQAQKIIKSFETLKQLIKKDLEELISRSRGMSVDVARLTLPKSGVRQVRASSVSLAPESSNSSSSSQGFVYTTEPKTVSANLQSSRDLLATVGNLLKSDLGLDLITYNKQDKAFDSLNTHIKELEATLGTYGDDGETLLGQLKAARNQLNRLKSNRTLLPAKKS